MKKLQPMSADEQNQQRVHATVPLAVYRRFRAAFPDRGAIQWAMRMTMEALPEMLDRDEAYKRVFMEQMRTMFEADRVAQSAERTETFDLRQLDLLEGIESESIDEEDES